MIDGIPVQRDEAMSYPANLIIAVEVYRRMHPLEFGGPRQSSERRPLVPIWTLRP